MEKIYVAAIDFGTENSGVVFGGNSPDIINNHYTSCDEFGYAKMRTAMFVRKDLLSKIASCTDSDCKIMGVTTDCDSDENLIVGGETKTRGVSRAVDGVEPDEWVYFEYFKMPLYKGDTKIQGSNGESYSIEDVISLILRAFKLRTLKKMATWHDGMSLDEINARVKWGVTIPTIWEDSQKQIMKRAAKRALGLPEGEDVIALLEPEGAAFSFAEEGNQCNSAVGQSGCIGMQNGEKFIVIDCGGGTTDIVIEKVARRDNVTSYEEVTSAKGRASGGADIDKAFYELLAKKIASLDNGGTVFDPYEDYLLKFRKSKDTNGLGWHGIEAAWKKLKHSPSFLKRVSDEYLALPDSYWKWLERNHPSVKIPLDRLGSYKQIKFTNGELLSVVQPTVNEIVQKVDEVWSKESDLDYVFLAGGLSGLGLLREAVADLVGRRAAIKKARLVCESTDGKAAYLPGGSIMRGAAYLLYFERSIRRRPSRYYYVATHCPIDTTSSETIVKSIASSVLDSIYETYDDDTARSEAFDRLDFVNTFDSEMSKLKPDVLKDDEGTFVRLYLPICVPDLLASTHKHGFRPASKEQETIKVTIYSSHKYCVLWREGDPDIRDEGSVTISCKGIDSFNSEVDFNDCMKKDLEMIIFEGKSKHEIKRLKFSVDLKVGR